MLSLYLSLVVFQLGGLLYRLCYGIKFINHNNVKRKPGVATFRKKTLEFLTGFAYKLLKI